MTAAAAAVVTLVVLVEALDKRLGHLVRVLRDEDTLTVEGLAVLGDEVDISQESVPTLRAYICSGEILGEGTTSGKRGRAVKLLVRTRPVNMYITIAQKENKEERLLLRTTATYGTSSHDFPVTSASLCI